MSPVLFREHKATFGPYLRELRVGRGISLRDAATRLGISFAKLQKMETGGRFRIVSAAIFEAVAALFERPLEEVLARAGVRFDAPSAQPDQHAVCIDATASPEKLEEAVNAAMADGWRCVAAVPIQTLTPHHFRPVTGHVLVILQR
ncbi:MAG: helix-turn-helix transcriptional regulator [Pseudomonadota bacterium]|nr:helix-turn-helix transcriptional regulator [Pseudomonadota bacterium]